MLSLVFGTLFIFHEDIRNFLDGQFMKMEAMKKVKTAEERRVYYIHIEPINFSVPMDRGRLSRYKLETTIETYNREDAAAIRIQEPRIVDTFLQTVYDPEFAEKVMIDKEIHLPRLVKVLQEAVATKLFPKREAVVLVRALDKGSSQRKR